MITYFKMKQNEWKVKAKFYGMIVQLMDNQKDIITIIRNLYLKLKDVPAEDLKTEFILALAKTIHESKPNNNTTV